MPRGRQSYNAQRAARYDAQRVAVLQSPKGGKNSNLGGGMESQFDAVQSLKSIESNYGEEIAREVVQIFITDYPGKIQKLEKAIQDDNKESIRFVAHDIKSGCLSMGIQPMSALCEKIEREGAQLPKEELSSLSVKLQQCFDVISKDYGDYLKVQH
jgi:HPt (histidine-containing phosphotransfer) domain-containing protein